MLTTPAAHDRTTAEEVHGRTDRLGDVDVDVDRMLLERVFETSTDRPRVVLAESHDDRVLRAAGVLAEAGLVPVLIGNQATIRRRGSQLGISGSEGWVVENPSDLAAGAVGQRIRERAARKHPELTEQWLNDPICLAAASIGTGVGDAAIAGADRPTAEVIRAALSIVGLAQDSSLLSSSFLMRLCDGRYMGFGDCAVIPLPDEDELATIAMASARTFAAITGQAPSIAMLSFSTAGSARHADIDRVRAATDQVRSICPDLNIDGELQLDAAIVESVARSKAPQSSVAGHANVLIFPNLAAGNIGYKIAERLAGAQAFGPLLQGLAAPINDLSRGASVSDIVNVALITCLQAITQTTSAQQTVRDTDSSLH